MKTDLMQTLTVNLLAIELQLRVEGSNNLLSLYKNIYFFSLKPTFKSSFDGQYWPGL